MPKNSFPVVLLSEVMQLKIDAVPVDPATSYNISGVYSFGRGLFGRAPLQGSETTYKVFHRLHTDDYVLSQVKGWEGALARVTSEFNDWFLSPQFPTFRTAPDKLNIRYLEWYCKQSKTWDELRRKSRGMGARRETVSPADFLSLEIPLPTLDEQQHIVAEIEALSARIAEARGLHQGAMEDAQTFLAAASVSIFNENQWETHRLGEVLSEGSLNGIGIRPSDAPPGVPILRISAGTSRPDGIVNEQDFKFLEIDDKTLAKYRLKIGDLLACRFNGNLRYVGRFSLYQGYSDQEQIYPDKLMRFRVDTSRLMPAFVKEAMNSPLGRTQIEAHCATTAGNIGISAGSLKTVLVPVPPLDEQLRIVAHLNSLQSRVEFLKQLHSESNAELDALLPSILDRAFRGEL